MGWNFFKKNEEDENPEMDFNDLVLSKMKVGFLVDYDMKTYQITAKNYYQWDEGGRTEEWELKQGDEVLYLERCLTNNYINDGILSRQVEQEISNFLGVKYIQNNQNYLHATKNIQMFDVVGFEFVQGFEEFFIEVGFFHWQGC